MIKVFVWGIVCAAAIVSAGAESHLRRILVYSHSEGFIGSTSIANVNALMDSLGRAYPFRTDTSSDTGVFTLANLKQFDVVVFNNCSSNRGLSPFVTAKHEEAFRKYMEQGGGFFATALTMEGTYLDSNASRTWYSDFMIATERPRTPGIARIKVDSSAARNSELADLIGSLPQDTTWEWEDNWYTFTPNPRSDPKVTILLTADEGSPQWRIPDEQKMGDHPVSWCYKFPPDASGKQGRFLYTNVGWMPLNRPYKARHFLNALRWVAGDSPVPNAIAPKAAGPAPACYRVQGRDGVLKIFLGQDGYPHAGFFTLLGRSGGT